jgi:general secretion pathway protein I
MSPAPAEPPFQSEAALSDAGFTLLEVLVAFMIAGLAFAVLAGAALEGMRSASLSDQYQEGLARARSHLAAVGPSPQPADRQGDEGHGFHWHLRVVQLASAPVTVASLDGEVGEPSAHVSLYAISVAISWGDHGRRQVELDSEQVGVTPARSSP